jgi:octaprenyl-diphosphate synthase
MSLESDDFHLLKIVSHAVKLMSEGELLQIEKARTLNIDVAVYLEIIRMKTASLIASCTECGAASVTNDKNHIEAFRLFGEKIGLAFQIKDDLLDYGEDQIGKPLGIDIKEKKMTLPLIHALNQASWYDRRKVISLVKNHKGNKKELQWIKDFIIQNQGIAYSQKVMIQYKEEALEILKPFPESPSKQSLIDLVEYTIERSY